MLDVEFVQLLQDMIGDLTSAPEPLVIKLFSQDPTLLKTWAPQVAEAIKKVPGVVDVLDGIENTISGPATVFKVDQAMAARAGFTPQELELDASAIMQGEPAATPLVVNDRAYTIRVRFPESTRASVDAIKSTLLVSAAGHTGTLGTLATVEDIPGQTEVRRENLLRNVTVTARLENVDLGSGVAAVQRTIADLHLPSAIRIAFGGAYEEQQKSFKDLLVVLVLAVLLVFTVLLFEFGSFAAPVAVIASALLSTIGVFAALLVDADDVQPVVVHGSDHGDWHRRQEWHPPARCRSAVPRAGSVTGGEHDPGRRAAASSDRDDRTRDRRRHDSAGPRLGCRLADAAAAGDRSHRRHRRVDAAVARHDTSGALLSRTHRT